MCIGTGMGAAAVIENEQLWGKLSLWSAKTLVKFNFLSIILSLNSRINGLVFEEFILQIHQCLVWLTYFFYENPINLLIILQWLIILEIDNLLI